MTKAMRWGLSALMTVGCVGLGSVVGCSDDDDGGGQVTETDTGTQVIDTGSMPDTAIEDTGTMGETSGDTGGGDADSGPPFVADRAVSVVFASPDLSGKFLCAGGFAGDPKAATSSPAVTLGPPGGVPDPTAPTDPMKFKPIPYGAVVPIQLTKTAQDTLESTPLSIVLYLVDSTAKDCKTQWADVRAKENMWFAVKGGTATGADPTNTIKKGDSALIRIHGCVTPASSTTGECGTAAAPANLKIDMVKLDAKTPTSFSGGTTGPKVGIQWIHMTPFAGSATPPVPPFQAVDVYFQSMTAATGGDAGTDAAVDETGDATSTPSMPTGTPVKLATNMKYGDIATASVGVQIGGDPASSIVLLVPTGTTPCTPGSTGCLAVPLPVGKFGAYYTTLPYGGGFKDGTNQLVGLAGSPLKTATVMMPWGLANLPK